MTVGEAKDIVKGSEGENGFVAWKRLLDRYDAKSQARFLRDLLGVIQPGKARNFREVHSRVEGLETKLRNLSVTHGETLTDRIKLAILVGMLP